jgi:XTP/dITP diphosphohydrolase
MIHQQHRWLAPGPLIIATHNPGKLKEMQALLAPFGMECLSAGALGLPEPAETETSFIGNARIKSLAAARATGLPALSDDSGCCVDTLDGAPGVYTADWAGPTRDWNLAMGKVWQALEDKQAPTPRHAQFVCALSLAWSDSGRDGEGHTEDFLGIVPGQLVWPVRGTQGFGFDPMFMPEGYAQTFGEMAPADKHAISHRAAAFAQLVAACLTR